MLLKKFILFFLAFILLKLCPAQISGCTDPLAQNYNAAATINDGSCTYTGATISPKSSKNLSSLLPETSGLIHWNNFIWTHNDDTDTSLYALDTATAAILQTYPLPRVINKDWEEISQDDNYVYIGDFGNNSNGNRSDLHILRVDKNSLLLNTPAIDTIWFSYSNQTNFSGSGSNNTDFDCEAFIVSSDSIYLFTKQWVSNKTSIYALPKTPGNYSAGLRSTLNIQGLATGATYLESKKLIVLLCYTSAMQPYLYLLYDFSGTDFTSGNKRKINLNLGLHQTEGIATQNGLKYYVSNERLVKPPINTPQKLHTFDLTNFLSNYLYSIPLALPQNKNENEFSVFPNPTNEFINIKAAHQLLGSTCIISDVSGKQVLAIKLTDATTTLNIRSLAAGTYVIQIAGMEVYTVIIFKN